MPLFSWFNSADHVDTALVVVAIIGAIIETGVAVAAVINVHKELEESRKEKLEKYIEIFACVAAFFFLAEAILGCRSSVLLGIELEKLKRENLVLEAKLQPRQITQKQVKDFIFLTKLISKIQISVGIGDPNEETFNYAVKIRKMLDLAGFGTPDSDTNMAAHVRIDRDLFLFDHDLEQTNEWGDLCIFFDGGNEFFTFPVEILTNGFTRPIANPGDVKIIFGGLRSVFNQIGISAWGRNNSAWANDGRPEIYIRQKPD